MARRATRFARSSLARSNTGRGVFSSGPSNSAAAGVSGDVQGMGQASAAGAALQMGSEAAARGPLLGTAVVEEEDTDVRSQRDVLRSPLRQYGALLTSDVESEDVMRSSEADLESDGETMSVASPRSHTSHHGGGDSGLHEDDDSQRPFDGHMISSPLHTPSWNIEQEAGALDCSMAGQYLDEAESVDVDSKDMDELVLDDGAAAAGVDDAELTQSESILDGDVRSNSAEVTDSPSLSRLLAADITPISVAVPAGLSPSDTALRTAATMSLTETAGEAAIPPSIDQDRLAGDAVVTGAESQPHGSRPRADSGDDAILNAEDDDMTFAAPVFSPFAVLGFRRRVVMPDSQLRGIWDVISLVGCLYYALVTPVQIGFYHDQQSEHGVPAAADVALLTLGWMVDV